MDAGACALVRGMEKSCVLCVCCSCATLVPRFTHACHDLGGCAVSMADSVGSRDSKDDLWQPDVTKSLFVKQP